MARRRSFALLLALPLLLAPVACGGDDDEASSDGTTTTGDDTGATGDTTGSGDRTGSGDEGTTTTAAAGDDDPGDDRSDPAFDQVRVDVALEAILGEVTAAGFAPKPDDDDDDGGFEFESAECRAFQAVFDGDVIESDEASAESGEYARGELGPNAAEETLEVNVGILQDTDRLQQLFDVLDDDRLPGCMEEALRRGFAERSAEATEQGGLPVTVQELAVERLPASGIGDQTAGVAIRCLLESAGFQIPFRLEVEFARSDRAVAMVLAGILGSDTLIVQRTVLLEAALQALTAPA